ncbi:YceI family protein [Mycolicibacterium sediminis]|uniref:Polyisoprenoid-binding protein n=1 Tax=Mycolicibacterium sediminis TaxID=1286180 RepID=A0A7I7QVG8_9MYCO|nr:YceI family protein [Mycolicibacterium sediminis]BBY30291.1 polyisoprenoid-binding protein [Mycolicibacterium sediminis]
MDTSSWTFDPSVGELLVQTHAAGPAARLGHDLTIVMEDWVAELSWSDERPSVADVTVQVASLSVLRGDGGVKSLSGPEKALVRSNALKALDAKRHPTIGFRCDDVAATDDGYRLAGSLTIHGVTRPCEVAVRVTDVGDRWHLTCESVVRQSDFGVTPYSLMFGSLKVADEVTVSFTATRPH